MNTQLIHPAVALTIATMQVRDDAREAANRRAAAKARRSARSAVPASARKPTRRQRSPFVLARWS